ncbi:MAG: hypothetical protein WAK35_01340 [Xanthobacteraceae bacterium]
MIDLVEALKAERPGFTGKPRLDAPLGQKRGAPKQRFTMDRLRRLAIWGAAAAAAVLAVAMTSRSDVAVERFAVILHRPKPATAPVFDAQAATAQLADAVRGLKVNDQQLQTRLAAVEHDMDVTGSIAKQIQAADASRRADEGPSVAATALASTAMAPVDMPPAAASLPALDPIKAEPQTALPALPKSAFGIDIGSGLTLQALRTRWAAIRTAHPQFFEGLQPIISVREVSHSTKIELRLVAGPIAQPGMAAALCAQLAALSLYCQPTIYDGQHLALR